MMTRLQGLIAEARAAGVFIIHVRSHYDDVHLSRAAAEKWVSRGWIDSLCRRETFGSEFAAGFDPLAAPNEALVTKHRFSSFWGSPIDLLLRSNGIRTVALTGISTEICVESHARDAFFRDYHVVEVSDCVECGSIERDQASKTVIARAFGELTTAEEVARVWRAAAPAPRGWHEDVKEAKLLGTLAERVDAAHTAFVLIDVQNDFCDERGAIGRRGEPFEMIKETLPRIRELLGQARQAGCLVVHIAAEYGPRIRNAGSPYLRKNPGSRDGLAWTASATELIHGELDKDLVEVCRPGTWGAEFVDGIVPRADELVIAKHRFSGFADTSLEQMLRSNGIRTVVLAGVTTNCCVESTARDAVMRDFNVVIAEDGVAVKDINRDLHAASLETMGMYFGLVRKGEEIATAWAAPAA
jgi:nicotinamidase-related amidase